MAGGAPRGETPDCPDITPGISANSTRGTARVSRVGGGRSENLKARKKRAEGCEPEMGSQGLPHTHSEGEPRIGGVFPGSREYAGHSGNCEAHKAQESNRNRLLLPMISRIHGFVAGAKLCSLGKRHESKISERMDAGSEGNTLKGKTSKGNRS